MIITHRLLGRYITCQVTELGGDISVLLTGGDRAHIGAVSLAGPGMETTTHVFPGHKEQHITAHWAEKIAALSGKNVCVQAGIHYHSATEETIQAILALTEDMLTEVLGRL